jgi:hypothetical protein
MEEWLKLNAEILAWNGRQIKAVRGWILPENKKLKLFVWHNVLTDWTPGIIFALAENIEQARKMIERDKEDWMYTGEIYEKSPEIITEPKGFMLYGGG